MMGRGKAAKAARASSVARSINELPWFLAVVEKSEAFLATVPEEQLSTWYVKQYRDNSTKETND